ncbi:MAG: 50S ribosomal protein L30 [Acidobacteriota bacterium]|nr:50S ribosomal protein L30 [Acidobacteriota bacterium]MDH3528486.1 50S ribosomal protein L30 [Acidobacteriota bacterium]
MAKKETSTDKLKIQYYKSVIGYSKKQKAAVKALGFTKLNQIVEKPDDASMRGVVKKLPHILRIVE